MRHLVNLHREDWDPEYRRHRDNMIALAILVTLVVGCTLAAWFIALDRADRAKCESYCNIENQTCHEDERNTTAMCSGLLRSCQKSCEPTPVPYVY